MNNKEQLLKALKEDPRVIEYQRLKALVSKNTEIKDKLDLLHETSMQMVNAKEIGLDETYFYYEKKYNQILAEFDDDVLVQSYLNAKEEVISLMKLITQTIEAELEF